MAVRESRKNAQIKTKTKSKKIVSHEDTKEHEDHEGKAKKYFVTFVPSVAIVFFLMRLSKVLLPSNS